MDLHDGLTQGGFACVKKPGFHGAPVVVVHMVVVVLHWYAQAKLAYTFVRRFS